ncbi:MAG: phasin family protein [Rhodospirillales bacterium]|nr:phasin family protein [Rhodospirillales bacterium]
MVYQITFGNLEAVLKSTDILARGMRMLNTAVIGSTCMTMDDTIADSRSAMSCRSVKTFVVREVDLAMVTVNRSLGRMTVLGRMASQLIEDALFPLERRFFIVFDLLNRKAA